MVQVKTPDVNILPPNEPAIWPESLVSLGEFVGLDTWMRFVNQVYRFNVYRLVCSADHGICGFLALVHVKHFIFGNYLTTAPFGSYGGFAFSSLEARDALLEHARALGDELGVDYVNVRFEAGDPKPVEGWIQNPVYATYRLDLGVNPENLLASYSANHRNHIRKSMKKGFKIVFGQADQLDAVYEVLARSMHELGSPYHSKSYLQAMIENLGGTVEFAMLRGKRGEPIGAGVFVLQGDTVTNLHANILRSFRPDYAGEYLYWSAIVRYCQKELKIFDLGRSLTGSGNETFKMKWNPRKRRLSYCYCLRAGVSLPELNQKNPKFKTAIWLWQHLPSSVVRPIGPSLIKGLA